MFLILRAHNYINVHFLWSVLVEWPFNAKSSAVFPTAYLPDTPNPTHAHTHTHTHPSIVSPYIYLTALRAPSKTFMTIWLNQQRQIISFPFFFSFNVSKGIWVHGFNRCSAQSFWVSCLLTGWADADMTTSMWVFIANHSDQDPVGGVSTCVHNKAARWQQELGFGPAIQRQLVLLSILLLFYFGYICLLLSIIWQMKKRKKIHRFVCLVVKWKT